MTTITLSRPVRVIDKEVGELTFREPNGKDLVVAGYPIRFGDGDATEIDARATTILIARLASIPVDSAERLAVPDWVACMRTVMGFFGVRAPAATSSTDTSSAPASGAIN